MPSDHGCISFLHLPLEIRNIIYDLAFVPVEHGNILSPTETPYTKEAAPLLYVHPSITADLRSRLYQDDFSIVLPIQEPSEFAKGRGFSEEALQECLDRSSRLMKQRCGTLVIEACQTSYVMTEWDPEDYPGQKKEDFEQEEDYEHWEGDEFAANLVPYLLKIKKELPALKTIKFILWLVEWEAPLDGWRSQLEELAREWVKLDESKKATQKKDSTMSGVSMRSGGTSKPSLDIHFQVNTFDYYDQDAGDGGKNWIQVWSEFADDDQPLRPEYLNLLFVAMDLKWDDHITGHFYGWQFDPEGWENVYINTMPS
ncbi:hypothetical protein N0V84_003616 [Fusarium piperis]|uniref:Uncharacterized protein n=1 Tax=Fusarium piperis TaxID=1435070 RepID=A0A9W8WHC0_9HYPO|nr:hypothetical protein N0V84_003616 [Fusarium piperis]